MQLGVQPVAAGRAHHQPEDRQHTDAEGVAARARRAAAELAPVVHLVARDAEPRVDVLARLRARGRVRVGFGVGAGVRVRVRARARVRGRVRVRIRVRSQG